jgi:hypothetical protein
MQLSVRCIHSQLQLPRHVSFVDFRRDPARGVTTMNGTAGIMQVTE